MAESISLTNEYIQETDYKDLTRLHTNKFQHRDPAQSDLRPINALDVETYNGNVFLIADSDGRYLDKITPQSLIKFIYCKKYENSWNFFYNLGYDAEVIAEIFRTPRSSSFLVFIVMIYC